MSEASELQCQGKGNWKPVESEFYTHTHMYTNTHTLHDIPCLIVSHGWSGSDHMTACYLLMWLAVPYKINCYCV